MPDRTSLAADDEDVDMSPQQRSASRPIDHDPGLCLGGDRGRKRS
jgi:hypothetical protein